jgi:electron transfer flavoprotein alpha subunit
MAVDTIWVVLDRQGDKVAGLSLELLTKARSLAGTVEAVTWGDDSGKRQKLEGVTGKTKKIYNWG